MENSNAMTFNLTRFQFTKKTINLKIQSENLPRKYESSQKVF